ncbi:MAG: cation diffusion facilitator family transporter [Oscillospiraceae bacterium]|nr:cation diffusion facilitator family transporter [Oscillospiraceae bacterium]
MKLFYKLFRQNPETRDGIIATTSGIGILANVLIALIKIILGLLTSSIAIISEGANNAADVLSSVMTLVGAKLARKHPDEKHPFGYGRIEYIGSLVIAVVILVTGIEMVISSIKLIVHPEEISISYLALALVALSAVIKFFLGNYTIRMGKKADSGALEAVGSECRADSFASVITILSALVLLIFHRNLDAYAGLLTSLLILKAGFDALKATLGDIIGRPGDEELAKKLYQEIRGTEGIVAAADMMLHNYGPDAWSGSVNVEIDCGKTVGESYQFLHELQLRILQEYRVTMVFGIYAVDRNSDSGKELRGAIASFVRSKDHVKSFHAVYIDEKSQDIYCDFIVDYSLRNWDRLQEEFKAYMAELYPGKKVFLTIETEFV